MKIGPYAIVYRIVFVGVWCAAMVWFGWYFGGKIIGNRATSPLSLLEGCFEFQSETDRGGRVEDCVKEQITDLLRRVSAAELMASLMKPASVTFRQCHYLGHYVGAETYRRLGSLEQTLDECGDACTGACIHGATAQAMIAEVGSFDAAAGNLSHPDASRLIAVGSRLCSSPGTCHGVGHALFEVLRDVRRALEECETLTAGMSLEFCYRGVFMERAGRSGAHNFLGRLASHTDEPELLEFSCLDFASRYHRACFRYYPRILEVRSDLQNLSAAQRWQAMMRECTHIESSEAREACIEGFGFHIFSLVGSNPAKAHEACMMPQRESDQRACILGMIFHFSRLHQDTKGTRFCGGFASASLRYSCYMAVFDASRERLEREGTPLTTLCDTSISDECLVAAHEFYRMPTTTLLFLHYGVEE